MPIDRTLLTRQRICHHCQAPMTILEKEKVEKVTEKGWNSIYPAAHDVIFIQYCNNFNCLNENGKQNAYIVTKDDKVHLGEVDRNVLKRLGVGSIFYLKDRLDRAHEILTNACGKGGDSCLAEKEGKKQSECETKKILEKVIEKLPNRIATMLDSYSEYSPQYPYTEAKTEEVETQENEVGDSPEEEYEEPEDDDYPTETVSEL